MSNTQLRKSLLRLKRVRRIIRKARPRDNHWRVLKEALLDVDEARADFFIGDKEHKYDDYISKIRSLNSQALRIVFDLRKAMKENGDL